MPVLTQDDWNGLLAEINSLAVNPPSGCTAKEELPSVTAPHIWTPGDITAARDKLVEICNENTFAAPIDGKWRKDIIDELEEAIEDGWCGCCELSSEEDYYERDYTLIVFPTASEKWNNEHAPLNYETEGNTVAESTYSDLQSLETLLTNGASEAAVNAQIAALNTSAQLGWNYATLANTERYYCEPLSQWLNPAMLKTSMPTIRFMEHMGTQYWGWTWCKSYVTLAIEYHGCAYPPESYNTYTDNYRFQSTPGKQLILKNTYPYDPQSMFGQNHKKACASNYVGTWECDEVDECVSLLVGSGVKFNVTAEYHTSMSYYPGYEV